MAELILDKPPDASSPDSRLGYHVSAGYGQAAKVVNGGDAPFTDGSNFFLKEAYLSYLAPVGKGLTITVGKFVTTPARKSSRLTATGTIRGAFFSTTRFLSSTSGRRRLMPFNRKWSVNGSLVNGWNNTKSAMPPVSEASTARG